MIIGHFPAGYVVGSLLLRLPRMIRTGTHRSTFILASMVGAVAPDFDMLYFHLIDHRQHHHHSYISHYPVVWATILMLSLAWLYSGRKPVQAILTFTFTLNAFIHLCLDTIVGDIWWLAPFVDRPFALATVPALYHPWWLNFLLHWSFLLEIAVLIWAIVLWRRARLQSSRQQTI